MRTTREGKMKETRGRCEFCFCAIALFSCAVMSARCGDGGGGNEDVTQDPDALEDPHGEDTQAEVPHDPTAEEAAADPQVEDPAAEDAAVEETATDTVEEDAAADPNEEDGTGPACAALGGVCTDYRWGLCPTGLEPAAGTPHSDCPMEGWCCVDAPASPCSDESNYDCVAGTFCEDLGDEWGPCWGTPPESYDCEAGRVCCMDICW